MLSNIGNFLLFLNIFLSFLVIFYSFQNLKTSQNKIFKNIYQINLFQCTSILVYFFPQEVYQFLSSLI